MKYRTLGRTGLLVSEIGFGAWGIGGAANGAISYGPTDDRESEKALRRAFDVGVTFYDTADLYGYGHSEHVIGTVFKDMRDRVVIASKVGLLNQEGAHDFSPGHIQKSIEGSLRRLQSDYLDLYQLHDPPLALLQQDPSITESLRSLEKEGKIRAWGISVRSQEEAFVAIANLGVRVVQVNFNMTDQRVRENGLMALCRAEQVGLICRTPLCFGFLTGRYSADTQFGALDHRSRWPSSQLERWTDANALFSRVKGTDDQTDAQFALRYCLSYPEVSTTIPGMLTDKEVEENVGASLLGPLADQARLAIEAIYKDHKFFVAKNGAAWGMKSHH